MRTCTCSLIGIAQAIALGFILGCRDMCTHNENGGEVSAQDFSSDRYSYMGIYLQRGPRDVVPLVDERLQGHLTGKRIAGSLLIERVKHITGRLDDTIL